MSYAYCGSRQTMAWDEHRNTGNPSATAPLDEAAPPDAARPAPQTVRENEEKLSEFCVPLARIGPHQRAQSWWSRFRGEAHAGGSDDIPPPSVNRNFGTAEYFGGGSVCRVLQGGRFACASAPPRNSAQNDGRYVSQLGRASSAAGGCLKDGSCRMSSPRFR